jgi:EmrB/QacA subfamily drug resistance transporter
VYGDMSEVRVSAPGISRAAWAAASVMALGGFLGNMDGSIVAVGLESMRRSLGTGLAEIQWVATAYLLGLSAALPLTSWLVRALGAGRLWLYTLGAFVAASVLCALAPSAPLLIAVRAAQGMTAGVMVAAGQTVIGLAVGPERLGRMMATLGLVVGLAPIVGPSVGGFLLARASWPWLFWVNVPVGLLAMALGLRLVPRGSRSAPPPMDWVGLLAVSSGLPVVVWSLTEVGSGGAPLPYALCGGVGLAFLLVFARRSLRRRDPVLRLRLAARPVMGSGLLSVVLGGASTLGTVLLLPLWAQLRLGMGTVSTGLLLVPMGLGTMLVMAVAGRLTDRYGGGAVALVGSLAVLATTFPFPWLGPSVPMPLVQALLAVRGAGQGLTMMPAMTAAYASVSAPDLGDATALANIAMRIGGALGGALCVLVLSRGLAAGAAAGFAWAFGVLFLICVLATASSAWLRHNESREEPR